MINILEKIIARKREIVEEKRALFPIRFLEKSIYFSSPCVSLKKYILRSDKTGIIAEFKRKSPSRGMINEHANAERTSIGYMQAGACALSVLTDTDFFGGSNEDLSTARKFNFCPILRKDFIIDEYQITEAKSIGADAILLLANVLSKQEIKKFTELAQSLGMEVLLELHDDSEISKISGNEDVLGINNRDLKSFSVDHTHGNSLITKLPTTIPVIAESGIESVDTLLLLREKGFSGFLIGERFMKHNRPELACANFIAELNEKIVKLKAIEV